MQYSPTNIARQFLFVREAGPNKGQRVEAIQRWAGGQPGDSWCCELATMVLDICFQGAAPVPRLRACQDVYNMAKAKGWVLKDDQQPQKDDIYLFVNDADHAHHIGFVTDIPGNGISGNTSADGTSSNGDRIAEHKINMADRKHIKFIRYQKPLMKADGYNYRTGKIY